MNVAALVVSIVAALAAIAAVWYARRSDRSAARSAVASERRAVLEAERRHEELTPRFRVSVSLPNPGARDLSLAVFLVGPPELGRLDSLVVRIRNDHPWRSEKPPLPGGPSAQEVAAQVWGPFRFVPGTGPGADSLLGISGADSTGRVTPTGGMPVGESLLFVLEPTLPPPWSGWSMEGWQANTGSKLRLRLEARRDGWEPWVLVCELRTPHEMAPGTVTVEVP